MTTLVCPSCQRTVKLYVEGSARCLRCSKEMKPKHRQKRKNPATHSATRGTQ